MFPILVQTLLFASSGLLSVGSITLVILLLISERGWKNGLGYAIGYTGAYSLIGILAVILGYRTTQHGSGGYTRIVLILLLAAGTLLIFLAFSNWHRPPVKNPDPPRIFSVVDSITPFKAFGFGAMVSVINFKNLTLYLTSLSVVILSDLILPQKIITALLAALVFCLSVIIPVSIYILFPKGARSLLGVIKNTIQHHSRIIGIMVPMVFGLVFIIKAIMELL